ncbi:hypothetical protein IGI04_028936 [Brassica rapa subsp. trilocularis]|uniref:Uncharacterized protein n=1 Tax=Brassica rapa subsp. trilocularis TaxID=1813537 RepID=A0ABQ7L376_BRACM|nr:hypothetical protein IGI04_028936 [Brassica rapa subsp. trilocularis]
MSRICSCVNSLPHNIHLPASKNVLGRNATTSAFGSWQMWFNGRATELGCWVDVTAGSSRLGLFDPVVEDGVEDDETELSRGDEDIFAIDHGLFFA